MYILNPNDTNAGIVLGEGNSSAYQPSASWVSSRATIPLPAGKIYFEGQWFAGGFVFVGIGTKAATINSYCGSDAYGWGLDSNNGTLATFHSASSSTITSGLVGDIFGVAYDGRNLWFTVNGKSLGGSAEAGISPAYTGVTGILYPMVSAYGGSWVRLNLGQRPLKFLPRGFKPVYPGAAITPARAAYERRIWVPGGPVVPDLTVEDATSTPAVDAVAITQDQNLSAASATSTPSIDSVAISQVIDLSVSDASATPSVDDVAIILGPLLQVEDATSTGAIDEPVITQAHALVVADAASTGALDAPSITQVNELSVEDAEATPSIDGIAITIPVDLSVEDATSTPAIDSVALAVNWGDWSLVGPSAFLLGHDPDLGDWAFTAPGPALLSGSINEAQTSILLAPVPTLTGRGGWRTELTAPAPTLSGYSEWEGHWSIALTGPEVGLTGSMLAGGVATVRLLSPMPTLTGRTGWRAELLSPMPVLTGGWDGRVAVLHGTLLSPAPVMSGEMVREAVWTGTLVAPSAFFRAPIRAILRAPMPLLSARLAEVVVTEIAAYVFTLAQDGAVAAVTRYENFPFLEVLRAFDNRFLLVGPDGLYEFTGEDDDGDAIASSFTTGSLDLAQGEVARLVELWLRTRVTSGAVHVSIVTDEQRRDEYEKAWRSGSLVQPVRVRLGQGRLSTNYQVTVSNVDGGTLGVESIDLVIDPGSRRVA
jgi:hypothetical protein